MAVNPVATVDVQIRPVGADSIPREINAQAAKARAVNVKVNSAPLGTISRDLKELDRSLQASNSRVIAFGATTGVLYSVTAAFRGLVSTTIETEKELKNIQVILQASNAGFNQLKSTLFDIAGATGTSFKEASTAAAEFARQGLGLNETLKRTRDALILSRIATLDSKTAVQDLTAAINTFQDEALDSTTIISKLVAVDASFAVSSADLAEAIKRTGAVAKDAGLNFDELVGAVTAVQQATSRGGAVIGNALRNIFTRVQGDDATKALERFGVATKDLFGELRPTNEILTEFAEKSKGANSALVRQTETAIAGKQQINILKTYLADLARQNSITEAATQKSAGATDEAVKRNEELNTSLSALINKSKESGAALASAFGDKTVGPALRSFLKTINTAFESLKGASGGDSIGAKIGSGIIDGIGIALKGPGLVLVSALLYGLFKKVGGGAIQAIGELSGLNKKLHEQEAIQKGISQALNQGRGEYLARFNNATSTAEKEDIVLKAIAAQNTQLRAQQNIYADIVTKVQALGGKAIGPPIVTGGKDRTIVIPPRKAEGYIPNASDGLIESIFREKHAVARGAGGASSSAEPKVIENFSFGGGRTGRIVANTHEYIVKNFAGGDGSAVFNPRMIAQVGGLTNLHNLGEVEKVAHEGFVPNQALPNDSVLRHYYKKAKKASRNNYKDWRGYGFWDNPMGQYNKNPMLLRGTRTPEVKDLLGKGQFQSYWSDPSEKSLTWVSGSMSEVEGYANRKQRHWLVSDPVGDAALKKGDPYILGLRQALHNRENISHGMQGSSATNAGLRNPLQDSDLRGLFKFSGGKPTPMDLRSIKEMAGLARGFVPNFVGGLKGMRYRLKNDNGDVMDYIASRNASVGQKHSRESYNVQKPFRTSIFANNEAKIHFDYDTFEEATNSAEVLMQRMSSGAGVGAYRLDSVKRMGVAGGFVPNFGKAYFPPAIKLKDGTYRYGEPGQAHMDVYLKLMKKEPALLKELTREPEKGFMSYDYSKFLSQKEAHALNPNRFADLAGGFVPNFATAKFSQRRKGKSAYDYRTRLKSKNEDGSFSETIFGESGPVLDFPHEVMDYLTGRNITRKTHFAGGFIPQLASLNKGQLIKLKNSLRNETRNLPRDQREKYNSLLGKVDRHIGATGGTHDVMGMAGGFIPNLVEGYYTGMDRIKNIEDPNVRLRELRKLKRRLGKSPVQYRFELMDIDSRIDDAIQNRTSKKQYKAKDKPLTHRPFADVKLPPAPTEEPFEFDYKISEQQRKFDENQAAMKQRRLQRENPIPLPTPSRPNFGILRQASPVTRLSPEEIVADNQRRITEHFEKEKQRGLFTRFREPISKAGSTYNQRRRGRLGNLDEEGIPIAFTDKESRQSYLEGRKDYENTRAQKRQTRAFAGAFLAPVLGQTALEAFGVDPSSQKGRTASGVIGGLSTGVAVGTLGGGPVLGGIVGGFLVLKAVLDNTTKSFEEVVKQIDESNNLRQTENNNIGAFSQSFAQLIDITQNGGEPRALARAQEQSVVALNQVPPAQRKQLGELLALPTPDSLDQVTKIQTDKALKDAQFSQAGEAIKRLTLSQKNTNAIDARLNFTNPLSLLRDQAHPESILGQSSLAQKSGGSINLGGLAGDQEQLKKAFEPNAGFGGFLRRRIAIGLSNIKNVSAGNFSELGVNKTYEQLTKDAPKQSPDDFIKGISALKAIPVSPDVLEKTDFKGLLNQTIEGANKPGNSKEIFKKFLEDSGNDPERVKELVGLISDDITDAFQQVSAVFRDKGNFQTLVQKVKISQNQYHESFRDYLNISGDILKDVAHNFKIDSIKGSGERNLGLKRAQGFLAIGAPSLDPRALATQEYQNTRQELDNNRIDNIRDLLGDVIGKFDLSKEGANSPEVQKALAQAAINISKNPNNALGEFAKVGEAGNIGKALTLDPQGKSSTDFADKMKAAGKEFAQKYKESGAENLVKEKDAYQDYLLKWEQITVNQQRNFLGGDFRKLRDSDSSKFDAGLSAARERGTIGVVGGANIEKIGGFQPLSVNRNRGADAPIYRSSGSSFNDFFHGGVRDLRAERERTAKRSGAIVNFGEELQSLGFLDNEPAARKRFAEEGTRGAIAAGNNFINDRKEKAAKAGQFDIVQLLERNRSRLPAAAALQNAELFQTGQVPAVAKGLATQRINAIASDQALASLDPLKSNTAALLQSKASIIKLQEAVDKLVLAQLAQKTAQENLRNGGPGGTQAIQHTGAFNVNVGLDVGGAGATANAGVATVANAVQEHVRAAVAAFQIDLNNRVKALEKKNGILTQPPAGNVIVR